MKTCVFCGSSNNVERVYLDAAQSLGEILAARKMEVYYGAGNTGLMGVLSQALLQNNGVVNGVIPKETLISNMVNQDITKIYTTNCLSSRKKLMLDACDIFIILPGGIGTIDEFLDVIAYKQINARWAQKKCILINVNGYFDLFLEFLQHALRAGFTRSSDTKLFDVITNIEDISSLLSSTNGVPV
jgi:uncharacterized protein (TIGR00730 family)